LRHRSDQLLWQLRQLVGELDRPRRTSRRSGSDGGCEESDLGVPSHLKEPLLALDSAGRELLRRVKEQEEDSDDDDDDDENNQGGLHNGGSRSNGNGKAGERSSRGNNALRASQQLGRAGGDRRARSKRLRSRNTVVDDWLHEEGGDDAYADLEDFLVA
jgi:hypothetical protein